MSFLIIWGLSLIPARMTVWFPTGTPAFTNFSQAFLDSGVISKGVLKWVFNQTGWYFCKMEQSLSVIRWGNTTGARVPMRMTSTWVNYLKYIPVYCR